MTTCILVADAAHARLLSWHPGHHTLDIIERFEHPEGRLSGRDLVSDRPGRRGSSAGSSRRGGTERLDPRAREEVRFARKLAARLDEVAQDTDVDGLAVVAPPKFLGLLRKSWGPQARSLLVDEVAGDLTNVPDPAIREKLTPYFYWLAPLALPRNGD